MPYDRTKFITRTALEGVCFDFMQEEDAFIADKVATPKPADKALVKALQFDTSKLRLMETRKKTDQEADLIDEQIFSHDITLEEHKLGSEVNPMLVRDADIPSMVSDARKAKLVTHALMLKREDLVATLCTTSSNFMSNNTSALAAGSRWNDPGGDPEADKKGTVDPAVLLSVGRFCNACAMDAITLRKLQLSANFRDRVKYTGSGPVSMDAIMAFFDIQYLFVAKARVDSAVEGAAASVAGFWSTNALFFVYNPSNGLEDVSFAHLYMKNTPFWTKTIVDDKRTGPAGSMRRVQVGTEYKADMGYVESASSTKFAAGYLLRTVVN